GCLVCAVSGVLVRQAGPVDKIDTCVEPSPSQRDVALLEARLIAGVVQRTFESGTLHAVGRAGVAVVEPPVVEVLRWQHDPSFFVEDHSGGPVSMVDRRNASGAAVLDERPVLANETAIIAPSDDPIADAVLPVCGRQRFARQHPVGLKQYTSPSV